TPAAMHQLAELSVRAHLEKLMADGRVFAVTETEFALAV
ncbi:MAG: hypothetical protein JNK38_14775, partial [Acidobacteria bacterium]|nr:hypothetical protein [Acidobacteriota bacterium]